MKKLGYLLIPILLVSNLSFAAGKAYVSSKNETPTPIAFVDSSNNMIAVTGDSTNGIDVDVTRISGTVTTATSTTAIAPIKSSALEASHIIKASAGTLLNGIIRLDSTAPTGTYYIQVLNAASVPANGAVTHLITPKKIQHITGTDDTYVFDRNISAIYSGVSASTGIVVVLSSTEFTLTISGSYLSVDVTSI